MKLLSNSHIRVLTIAGLTVLSASQAWAVIPFSWITNGSGVITDGSWVGNGAVQNNLNPTSTVVQIAVQDFSSGAFGINRLGGSDPGNVYSIGRILTDPLAATHTISLTGGTADLRLHNSSTTDGGTLLFNSVGLTDFQGVTSVSWTIRFSEPIAGRSGNHPNTTSRPMGSGLALVGLGTGQTQNSFTVGMTYSEIYSTNSFGGAFVEGVPSGALPYQSAAFAPAVAGATTFTAPYFNGANFDMVRGYEMDGVAGYSDADLPLVYMREMTWTIRRDDNLAFAADTVFVTSMDGQQYTNYVNVIPEPTSYLLVAGSLVGGCLLRRRRA